jgi:transaldolase
VAQTREIFMHYGLECEVLAASVRTPVHFIGCARAGADAATVPPAVLRNMLVHPLTDRGVDQFLNDWSKRVARSRAAV